ncbi:Pimeloyl-ACP methyl ester carboxylesterase [Seinonella peptonophila]|uniref:Pimeloyl-ACP methyl ester carboxylesterase n=1 Tax=Seinonella peptonophila TaxID=112248 RepID=A0A1M4STC6_9BACL|nr:alpha/beta hydrolase [Seinonella peptonophila]SHE35504.1 Pimeloyl-ACP methyl ester carboxylesterase [Seinonella peptonophila]
MKQIITTSKGNIEYQLEGKGKSVILILNGGHCSSCDSPIPFKQLLINQGFQLLIPSRPGYGRTPSSTGKISEQFTDAIVELLDSLHIKKVIVIAISAGGRTALQLGGRHPKRVEKIILQGALTHNQWPDTRTRFGAYIIFNPVIEKSFWAFFRLMLRKYPLGTLKVMMRGLTNLPVNEVLEKMNKEQINKTIEFLGKLQSGSGFLNDIQHRSGDLSRIQAPTLIIHSQHDGGNPISHANYAAKHIPNAELFITEAESHLIWFSHHNDKIEQKIIEFLQ